MRILIAAHNAGRLGGVESYLATLVPALAAAGHDVACWFEGSGGDREPIVGPAVTAWTANGLVAETLDAVRRWTPDVIYTHGLRSPDIERRLLEIAPAVLFMHSYYGTCISGSKMHMIPGDTACTRRFGPACLALFHPRRCGGWNPGTMLGLYRLQAARLALMRSYRRIGVASRHMAGELERHGLAASVSVIGLPVEPAVQASQGTSRDTDAWRLLYLGRLERTKGADLALEAAALVAQHADRPIVLTVAGSGPLEASLRARASALAALDPNLSVHFAGWIGDEERTAAFRGADLLLIPSRWPEPFGLVGPEAGAHGVPAVAFAVGGIPEWLTDGGNGRLVPADPPDARPFAAAVTACLSDARGLAAMRERSRAAASRFSPARHLERLETLLRSAVGERPVAVSR